MANKTTSEKNKPTRKTLRADEYYNPKTKRYEYHYKDALGKERVVSSYRLEPTDQLPKGKITSDMIDYEDYPCEMTMTRWRTLNLQSLL